MKDLEQDQQALSDKDVEKARKKRGKLWKVVKAMIIIARIVYKFIAWLESDGDD